PSICVQETCGDGIRTPGEECDDNNPGNNDGCTSCIIDAGWACPVEGEDCVEKCGDSFQVGDEECDDGNRTNGDGCSGGCLLEPGSNCSAAATPPATPSASSWADAVCGDGTLDPRAGCDEGDVVGGDGCGPTCQNEPVITPGPNPTVSGLDCGDGIITYVGGVLEECDDGNLSDGDGCSSSCEIELDASDQPTHTCTEETAFPEPDMDGQTRVRLEVTYRDFKADN